MHHLKTVSCLVFLIGVLSCAGDTQEHHEVTGGGTGARRAWMVAKPALLNDQKLGDLIKALAGTISIRLPSGSGMGHMSEGFYRSKFVYLQAMTKVGGVPREQGQLALSMLLDPQQKLCGGASCARVLGLSERQIDAFFDHMLLEAASLRRSPKRDLVVASLTPTAAFGESLRPWDVVTSVLHLDAHPLPPRGLQPTGLLTARQFEQATSATFVSTIQNYTVSGYQLSRLVETMSQEAALRKGISPTIYLLWHERCKMLNSQLPLLPKVTQPVYRGLERVPIATVAEWIQKWQAKSPLHLGPDDKPAVTSSTWNIDVATQFLSQKSPDLLGTPSTLSVVMDLSNHGGVGIEFISRNRSEAEVLIPAQRAFVIEDIRPLYQKKRTLYIKLRGI